MDAPLTRGDDTQVRFAWMPRPGTLPFHLMLAAVALLVLGPLGGIAAAYMNFTLGIFVPGQILAGILGSVVTYPYGAQGRHGANYMQTMAASVASLGAMAVLIQAAVWLGMEMPPTWQLILFITCVGMFGVGLGMLYTPVLVDRMRLDYPSGYAVANIIRALTDKTLLKRSVRSLGTGAGLGAIGGWLIDRVAWIAGARLKSRAVRTATTAVNPMTRPSNNGSRTMPPPGSRRRPTRNETPQRANKSPASAPSDTSTAPSGASPASGSGSSAVLSAARGGVAFAAAPSCEVGSEARAARWGLGPLAAPSRTTSRVDTSASRPVSGVAHRSFAPRATATATTTAALKPPRRTRTFARTTPTMPLEYRCLCMLTRG